MRIDGYEITRTADTLIVEEILGEETRSWRAMLNFCALFPTGFEPEWGTFVKKYTTMKRREVEAAVREYGKRCLTAPAGARVD